MTYSQTGKRTLFIAALVLILVLAASFLMADTAHAASKAISSEADFKKIAKDLDGDYYLTQDIKLSANTVIKGTFTGTLDGKGYSINMYAPTKLPEVERTYSYGRFMKAEGATFKNLKIKGASFEVKKSWDDQMLGGLVGTAKNCTFQKISITGTIKMTLSGGLDHGGIVAEAENCIFKSCTTSSKSQLIAETSSKQYVCIGRFAGSSNGCTYEKCTTAGTVSIKTAGMVRHQGFVDIGGGTDTYTNCTNKANITVSGGYYMPRVSGIGQIGIYDNCKNTGDIKCTFSKANSGALVGGIMCANNDTDCMGKVTNSSNSGDITVTYSSTFEADRNGNNDAAVGGIASMGSAINCKNSGKIKVYMKTSSAYMSQCVPQIGGIVGYAGLGYWEFVEGSDIVKDCKNTGSVSFTDNGTSPDPCVGGITGCGGIISECYNTASITVSKEEGFRVGGITGGANGVENCYNTGKVTGKGIGDASGIAATYEYNKLNPGYVRYNYNTGKITAEYHGGPGTVVNSAYTNANDNCIYDNYSTTGQLYGKYITGAKGTEVDAINFENCPALSQDIWKMNKDGTRLIFK
ncbi:MAG: hypothetical protein IJ987_01340 [Firmicutes bacterium]|nr:hypothetical protein [Bacillota bacterium]